MKVTQKDILITAITVWGEARGEPVEGQIAVAQVIRNRAKKNKTSPAVECLRPKQFSCWNKTDPNRKYLVAMLKNPSIVPMEFIRIADNVLNAKITLPLEDDVLWYMSKRLYDSPLRPKWTNDMEVYATIGKHVFLKRRTTC